MNTYSSLQKLSIIVFSAVVLMLAQADQTKAQQRRNTFGRSTAIVVDERLSVLRATPDLSGKLLRRIGRGKSVGVAGEKRGHNGVRFYRVNVTRRTSGWIQREALIYPRMAGEDKRLLQLIESSEDFDLIARARIFLGAFPGSRFRARVLKLLGEAAELAATKLSRDATRRLNAEKIKATAAPSFSFFLNYSGLDRYNRQGIRFEFDSAAMKFRYDGAVWREILRRHPRSEEADEAQKRIEVLSKSLTREP